MVPAVSFAYEGPELDIMQRMPRNSKRDHIVNLKLLSYGYCCAGMLQSFGAFYTYIYVFNDYGIRPITLLFIALEDGYFPNENDVYNPNLPNYGNSNYGREEFHDTVYWDSLIDSREDLRLHYVFRDKDQWSRCRWDPKDESIPYFWRISWVTDY